MANAKMKVWVFFSFIFFGLALLAFLAAEWGIWIGFGIVSIVFFLIGLSQDDGSDSTSMQENSSTPASYRSKGTNSAPFSVNSRENNSLNEYDLQNNFSKYSWREMEELVGELFRKKGYSVKVTPPTGDFGIDVEAKTDREYLGIQVKHWTYDVGVDDVIKTLGASLNFNRVILVSTKSFFTQAAWTFANKDANRYRIELWDTNRFRKELRDNMINLSKTRESGGFVSDTDSFDYDKGFNLDEVYDSPDEEFGKICTKCGNIVDGQYCVLCGKQVS